MDERASQKQPADSTQVAILHELRAIRKSQQTLNQSLLAGLPDGIALHSDQKNNMSIGRRGSERVLWDTLARGSFLYVYITSDSKMLGADLQLDGTIFNFDTIDKLNDDERDKHVPMQWYVNAFNEDDGIYSVALVPSYPFPFGKQVGLVLKNTDSVNTINVLRYNIGYTLVHTRRE